MNRKNLLLIIVILLLVALGNWLTEVGVKQVTKRRAAPSPIEQDYYLKEFTITAMDEQGKPRHQLVASQLEHFTSNEKTTLQQPRLVVYEEEQVVWQVSAQHGMLSQQEDELQLQGDVQLLRPDSDNPLQLNTAALRVYPGEGRASTDQAVTLTQANSRIDAVGMEIEQQSQRLLLLSQVRGRYEALVR